MWARNPRQNSAINPRSIATALHVLRSFYSAVRALYVVQTTFVSGFDSHSLPPYFNSLHPGKSHANQFGFGLAMHC